MKYKIKTIAVLTCVLISGSSIAATQDKPVFVFTKKDDTTRQAVIANTAKQVKNKVKAKESARILADNKKTSKQLLTNQVKPYDSAGLLSIGAGAEDNSGSEASKYKGGGTFDVSIRTGGFNYSIPFNKFAGVDISVLKTTDSSLSRESYFDLPAGLVIKGLPFIIDKTENGITKKVLSYEGNINYIDSTYFSVDANGNKISSGLRYQSTQIFSYKKVKGSLSVKGEIIPFVSYLDFNTGNKFYFDKNGLMVAITDNMFVSGSDQNYKHISRVYYKSKNEPANRNAIDRIVNATGQVLTFDYVSSGDNLVRISYPKNVNGISPQMLISPNRVITRFSDKEWVGMQFTTDFNGLITDVTDIITNNNGDVIKVNKLYQVTYGLLHQRPVILSMNVRNPQKGNERILTRYKYLGDSNNGFKFGQDTTIEQGLKGPDFYEKDKYETQVSVGDMRVDHIFDYMHNESKTISSVLIDGKSQILSKQENKFNPVVNKNGVGHLIASYQVPVSSEQIIYEKGVPIAKVKSETISNAYGMPIVQKKYKPVAYDGEYGAPISIKTNTYDPRHMVLIKSVATDNVTGIQSTETTKLDSNGFLPIEKGVKVVNLKTGEQLEMPKEITVYQTDTSGSGEYHVAGLPETKTVTDGSNTIVKKYAYYYNQEQNKLRTVETGDTGVASESVSIDGSIISKTDVFGSKNTFKYYDNGQPLSETDYLGHTENTQTVLMPDPKYKSQSITLETDALNNKTIKGYDWMGEEVFSSIPNKNKVGYSEGRNYYSFENNYPQKIKTVDKYGNYQLFFYDDLHRVNKVENYTVGDKLMNTVNISQEYAYDDRYGLYIKVIKDDGAGGVSTQYTSADGKQLFFEQEVIGGAIIKKFSYKHGDTGQLEGATTYDPNNIKNILTYSTYKYDSLGNKIATYTYISGMEFKECYHFDKWNNKPTYSQYFANGRLIHTSYVLSYNKYGNVKSRGYKVGTGYRWTSAIYDEYLRPVKMTDFNGNVAVNKYTKTGQIESKVFSYPDGRLDSTSGLKFTYDDYGRQLTLSNINDNITFLYTPMGAQLGEIHTANNGYKSSMTLNSKNDLDTYTDALGNWYKYIHSNAGRVNEIDSNLGTIVYKYDDTNVNPRKRNKMIEEDTHFTNANFKNNLTKSLPQGSAVVEGDLKKFWTYNDYGQKASLLTSDDKGNSLRVKYSYDNRQDIIKKVVTDISPDDTLETTYNYNYDDRNRLLSSSEEAVTSTKNGKISKETRLYQYTYDNNGNILHELDQINSDSGDHQTILDFTYSDKIDDQLVKMIKNADGKITTTTMKYDLNGNMISTKDE